MKYEFETLYEIWPSEGSGERLEVGTGRDGLGMIEIRQVNQEQRVYDRILMTIEQARLVNRAIANCLMDKIPEPVIKPISVEEQLRANQTVGNSMKYEPIHYGLATKELLKEQLEFNKSKKRRHSVDEDAIANWRSWEIAKEEDKKMLERMGTHV